MLSRFSQEYPSENANGSIKTDMFLKFPVIFSSSQCRCDRAETRRKDFGNADGIDRKNITRYRWYVIRSER